jgi:dihydroorotase
MKVLLKKARIVSKGSNFDGKTMDILVQNGSIAEIAEKIQSVAEVEISSPDLHVSIGWFDMAARFFDPGLEHKEDLASGLKAAASGGFTEVACLPNTKPVVQTKDNVQYLLSKSAGNAVQLHVIAAASENLEGKSMTEIFDLYKAGAVAFSDADHPLANAGLLVRLVQYLAQLDALLMVHAEEPTLNLHGVMHEGTTSVYLGQKGMPSIAEYLAVSRDLALLKYAGGKLHFGKISTAESVDLIRQAKAEGMKITCDVAVPNLVFDDSALTSFDTNYKTNPPLRTKKDQEALWKGIADGTIDAIVTDHHPHDEESKKLEFDQADFGMTQLETAFALLNQHYAVYVPLSQLVEKLTLGPRHVLNKAIPQIATGEKANLTVFDPSLEWVFEEKTMQTKSKNSPVLGNKLKGKALAIFHKGQFVDLRN